jgi:murein DD-endopeptidase MepM/ murein hydrolase activator NlpD
MSDQERNRGHHVVTMHAVKMLFDAMPGEKLLGLSPQQFFEKLDHAQAFADRSPAGPLLELKPLIGSPADKAPFGWGDTWMSSVDAPGSQMRHATADPRLTAQENLKLIQSFVVEQLMMAKAYHDRGDTAKEWQHLGAAVHCLEDSYSSAHMFRDATHPADPTASVQGINNFTWKEETRTHDGLFDQVPVVATDNSLARASDQAGALAVKELLTIYVSHVDDREWGQLRDALADTTDKFFHGPEAKVLDSRDGDWQQQRAEHLSNEASLGPLNPVAPLPVSSDPGNLSIDSSPHLPPDSSMLSSREDALMSINPPPEAVAPATGAPVQREQPPSESTAPYAHPTGGIEQSITKEWHHKPIEIFGRDPTEHAQDKSFKSWEHLNGKDILCPEGTPVYAVADGDISGGFGASSSKNAQLQGQRLHIKTADNTFFYAHLSKLAPGIQPGAHVHKGQLIGYSGVAGGVAHLHFAAEKPGTTMQVLHDSAPYHVDAATADSIAAKALPHDGAGGAQYTPFDANATGPDGQAIHINPDSGHSASSSIGSPGDTATPTDANWTHSAGQAVHVSADSSLDHGNVGNAGYDTLLAVHESGYAAPLDGAPHHADGGTGHAGSGDSDSSGSAAPHGGATPPDPNFQAPDGTALHVEADSSHGVHVPVDPAAVAEASDHSFAPSPGHVAPAAPSVSTPLHDALPPGHADVDTHS